MGVPCADELRQSAMELLDYQKDVLVDWSGVTQIDASIAQVLLSLRAGLVELNRTLLSAPGISAAVQNWLQTAGLWRLLGTPEPEI